MSGVLLFFWSVRPDALDYKLVVYLIFPCIAMALLSVPFETAIFCFFLYVGVEGAAKLLTRYNPVIHVGADIIVALLVLKAMVSLVAQHVELPHRFPFIVKLLSVHVLWFLIVFFNPYALSLEASAAAVKLYVTPALLFLFGLALCDNAKKMEFFLLPWVIVMGLHLVIGLYQGAVGPSSVTGWSPTYGKVLERFKGYPFRPFGLTSNPGGPAVYTYFVVTLVMRGFLKSRGLFDRLLPPVMVVAMIVMLLLCQVKSAIIKFIAAIIFYLVLLIAGRTRLNTSVKKNAGIFLLVCGILLSVGVPYALNTLSTSYSENSEAINRSFMAFDTNVMTQSRKGAFERFWTYAEQAPLGSGLSRIGPAVARFDSEIRESSYFKEVFFFADNLWVQVVVDLGLPGTFLITLFVVLTLYAALLAVRQAEDTDSFVICAAVFVSLIAIFSGSYGAEPILYNPEATFFWFFAGAMFRLAHKELKFSGGHA
ncbi:MAG TPA: O-antigen ligase family protein [Bdellovibrionota bacterium]